MDEDLTRLSQCLSLLGLKPPACLVEMEANGIPVGDALAAILAEPSLTAPTRALARAHSAALVAQARPELFGLIGELLQAEGIHPLSPLNWEGWDLDRALDLLQAHWRGPGAAPLVLLGLGRAPCSDLRRLPRGLRLQSLQLARCPCLERLPEGLEVQGKLEFLGIAVERIPAGLHCGGDLVLADLPRLQDWGGGIRIGGDLVLRGMPPDMILPMDLVMGGQVRREKSWEPPRGLWSR